MSQVGRTSALHEACVLKDEGNAALKSGDQTRAVRCWERALLLAGTSSETRVACLLNLALVALRDDRPDLAIVHCKAVLTADPKNEKALYRLARAASSRPELFGGGSPAALEQLRDELCSATSGHRDAAISSAIRDLDKAIDAVAAASGQPRCKGLQSMDAFRSAGSVGCTFAHSADGHCENLLVLLHGLGDTGSGFIRFATSAALPQTCMLALNAPQSVPLLGGGMWYPSLDPVTFDRKPWAESLGETALHGGLKDAAIAVAELCMVGLPARGWPLRRLHLLGFGDGAAVAAGAMALMLSAGKPVSSLTAVCGALPLTWAHDLPVLPQRALLGATNPPRAPFDALAVPSLLMYCEGDQAAPQAGMAHTRAVLEAAALKGAVGTHKCSLHQLSSATPRMPSSPSDVRPLMAHLASALALRSTALEAHPDVVRVA